MTPGNRRYVMIPPTVPSMGRSLVSLELSISPRPHLSLSFVAISFTKSNPPTSSEGVTFTNKLLSFHSLLLHLVLFAVLSCTGRPSKQLLDQTGSFLFISIFRNQLPKINSFKQITAVYDLDISLANQDGSTHDQQILSP